MANPKGLTLRAHERFAIESKPNGFVGTNRQSCSKYCLYWHIACIGLILLVGVKSLRAASNTPPNISNVPDQRIFPSTSTRVIPFTVVDSQTAASNLVVGGSSSDTNLAPNANIVFGGFGSNRTVSVTPLAGRKGATTITLTVTDSQSASATNAFKLTVADFTDIGAGLIGVTQGQIAWGDYDNDGDLDLLQVGAHAGDGNGPAYTQLYRNDGTNGFSLVPTPFPNVEDGSVAWGDYDNDGNLDVLIAGRETNGLTYHAKIFRNNGNGTFTLAQSFPGVTGGAVCWADFNNDGRPDALISGYVGPNATYLYRNDGNGTFTLVTNTGLENLLIITVACADYDNDGYPDILMAGLEDTSPRARLYHNNGDMTFSPHSPLLAFIAEGSVGWGDYDNDGDLDILVAGSDGANGSTYIYRNDGDGVFTRSVFPGIGESLVAIRGGRAIWADYDNDGDLDLFVTGYSTNTYVTKLYRNEAGSFIEADIALPGTYQAAAAWGDFDNDGDLDLVFCGYTPQFGIVTKLFRNEGAMPNAIPSAPTGLNAVTNGNIVTLGWQPASDANQCCSLSYNVRIGTSPNSADVLNPMADISTGFRRLPALGNAGLNLSHTFTNLPGGKYYFWSVEAVDAAFAGGPFAPERSFYLDAKPTISAIADLRVGPGAPVAPIAFTVGDVETPATSLILTASSSNTNLLPLANVVLAGSGTNRTLTLTPVTNLVGDSFVTVTVRDSVGNSVSESFRFMVAAFTDLGLNLPGYTVQPSLAWGDIDKDGFLDFYATGSSATGGYSPAGLLCRNLGGTNFAQISNTLPAGQQGEMAFGDLDNDGDLDVVSQSSLATSVQVRLNDGTGHFTYVFGTEFLYNSAIACGDYDNDGRLDFVAGGLGYNQTFTRLFQNGNGRAFNLVQSMPGVMNGELRWGDYDNDGDLDLALVGFQDPALYACAVYRNDNGVLADSGVSFPAGWYTCDWGDFDNDGYLDLIFSRQDGNRTNQATVIYRNLGQGRFVDSGVRLPGITQGSVQFGDFDNDGWLDILMTGASPALGTNITRVYHNNHDGTLTDIHADLPALSDGRAVWGDFDNDGDVDILLTGAADGMGLITRIYRNDIARSNSPPSVPTSLHVTLVTNRFRFSWAASTDANQSAGLSYNLRVGRSPGASDVMSPMADISSGRRRLPQRGNADLSGSWYLKNLAPGTYWWSVQAIDHSFVGSAFAPEQSFVVTEPPTISSIADQFIPVNSASAAIPFTISDAETPPNNLQLSAQSSNTNLVKAETGILFSGSGTNRTVTITPSADQLGSTTVTVTVTDSEGWSTSQSFVVNVFNSSPVISDITNQTLLPNSSTPPLAFTIADAETPSSNLVLTASSSNTNLVPVQNIAFGGADGSRTVTVTLASNQIGNATITITVADAHGGIATDSFAVEVQEFIETPIGLLGLDYSTMALGDYDNDGRLDILIAGYEGSVSITRIYHNDGNGNFTDINAGLQGVREGSVAWGDFDNDGWIDLVLTGSTNGLAAGVTTQVYRNNRNGTFTDIKADLPSVSLSTAIWTDFDNDGLPDLLISGSSPTGYVSSVYRNNGNGTFADVNAGLAGLALSAAACADFDRDGKVDILLSGVLLGSSQITRIYRNLGNGVFTNINAGLFPVAGGSVAWGDYDNDGWPDVLLTGSVVGGGQSVVYRNNRDGTFTQLPAYLPSIYSGFSAWGDYNNDGKLDILLCGATYTVFQSAVYRGNADGTFSDINDSFGFVGAYGAAGGWGDFDGDGRLDVLLSSLYATRLFKNVTPVINTPPAAPTGLSVALSNRSVTFNWIPPTDNQSLPSSLTYNLRVGTAPGGEDVVSPSSSPSGLRRVVRFGAAGQTNSWALEDPPVSGTYYWSVQAIDGAFAGSPFAAERSFTATFLPSAHTLKANNVSSNVATLNGIASAKGPNTAAWFEWGTTTNFGNLAGFQLLASNAVHYAVATALTSLSSESNYYFRLAVSNALGVTYGETMTFYSGIPPTVTTLSPVSVASTQVTLQAQLVPNRSAAYAWIEYGPTTNYGLATLPAYAGSSTNVVVFSQSVTGLTSFTTYHCHIVATNEYGLRPGPDSTFTTTAEPVVATLNATTTNLTTATFAANVNPNGLPTTTYFEYGSTTNYGSITAFKDIGSARTNLVVTQAVTGLLPGTLYHFRVVAANSSATSLGGNRAVLTLLPFTNTALRLPPMLLNGSVAWGDYNNDGLLDLVMTGQTNASASFPPITRIYRNDGTNFTELDVGIPGLRSGAVTWGDYNNDGRLDLLVSGSTNSVPTTASLICRVYCNDGNDTFTDMGAGLPGVFNSAVAWADFNNDGRLDFVFAGSTNSSTSFLPISRVYLNNGNGGFTNANVALPRLQFAAIACADYNNDGRVDILMAGATNLSSTTFPISAVFRNNGNGTFSNANAGLIGVRDAAVAWGDFNDDGDLDILLTGNTNATSSSTTTSPITRVYRNNGNGTFSDINAGFAGVYRGDAAWGDFDSDGKLDLLIAGEGTNSQTYLNVIYRNIGNGAFESFINGILGTTFSAASWGDYNNDGRLDVFVAGQLLAAPGGMAAIYRNLFPATNSPPAPPTAPQSIVSANAATFRWDTASDNATAADGLSYNLRVGTTPGGVEIFSPASAADGTRRIAAIGNVGQRKIWTLSLPPVGTFYWAVQAVDHSFAGSPFTPEQSFVLPGAPTITLGSVANLSTNSATLSGYIDANGFVTTAYFEWGATTNYGNTTLLTNFASNAAYMPISAPLTGLTSMTVYHWRLVATNSAGLTTSADQSFLLAEAPLIVSQSATNISASKATLTAVVNPRGGSTRVFFEWGLSLGYGGTVGVTNIGNGTNTVFVVAELPNLAAGRMFYYRAVASNAVGSTLGAGTFFETAPPPRFVDFVTQPNGAFQMQFAGASSLVYEVQASTNLSNWTVLGNAALSTNGWHLYVDLDATNYSFRYYRVRSP